MILGISCVQPAKPHGDYDGSTPAMESLRTLYSTEGTFDEHGGTRSWTIPRSSNTITSWR